MNEQKVMDEEYRFPGLDFFIFIVPAYCSRILKFHSCRHNNIVTNELQTAYQAYACRWEIELVIRYYNQACELDETRVHSDYSVIGSEFCSLLSSVITYRLLNQFEKEDLFDTLNYKKIMHVLTRAKKVKADNSEWQLIKMNSSQIDILQKLGLLEKPAQKKRGRKPESKTV